MREMISMVVVLTVLSAFSGGMLAAVRTGTQDKIENQVLKFQKAPAIKKIVGEVSNDPLKDRFKLPVGDKEEIDFFVGKYDGKPPVVTLERMGKGYGGDVGLMVGIDTGTDKIVGVWVTTHAETPGMGARAKDNPDFVSQFAGLGLDKKLAVKGDGGVIDAMSGATITSRAVCAAASQAKEIYLKLKPEIVKQTQQIAN